MSGIANGFADILEITTEGIELANLENLSKEIDINLIKNVDETLTYISETKGEITGEIIDGDVDNTKVKNAIAEDTFEGSEKSEKIKSALREKLDVPEDKAKEGDANRESTKQNLRDQLEQDPEKAKKDPSVLKKVGGWMADHPGFLLAAGLSIATVGTATGFFIDYCASVAKAQSGCWAFDLQASQQKGYKVGTKIFQGIDKKNGIKLCNCGKEIKNENTKSKVLNNLSVNAQCNSWFCESTGNKTSSCVSPCSLTSGVSNCGLTPNRFKLEYRDVSWTDVFGNIVADLGDSIASTFDFLKKLIEWLTKYWWVLLIILGVIILIPIIIEIISLFKAV